MGYRLSPDVYGCQFPRDFVFLDVRRDRYRQASGHVAVALAERTLMPLRSRSAALERLVSVGLLTFGEAVPDCFAWTRYRPPARSLLEEMTPGSASLRDLWLAAYSVIASAWCLQKRGFAVSVCDKSSLANFERDVGPCEDKFAPVSRRYLAARRLLPLRPKCLVDALALRAFATRFDLRVHICVGVRTRPFAAHCWAQTRTLLLNENTDAVAPFTPILVVE